MDMRAVIVRATVVATFRLSKRSEQVSSLMDWILFGVSRAMSFGTYDALAKK